MGLIRNHLFMLSCIVADSLGSLVCKREGGKKKEDAKIVWRRLPPLHVAMQVLEWCKRRCFR